MAEDDDIIPDIDTNNTNDNILDNCCPIEYYYPNPFSHHSKFLNIQNEDEEQLDEYQPMEDDVIQYHTGNIIHYTTPNGFMLYNNYLRQARNIYQRLTIQFLKITSAVARFQYPHALELIAELDTLPLCTLKCDEGDPTKQIADYLIYKSKDDENDNNNNTNQN
eukprot:UN10147